MRKIARIAGYNDVNTIYCGASDLNVILEIIARQHKRFVYYHFVNGKQAAGSYTSFYGLLRSIVSYMVCAKYRRCLSAPMQVGKDPPDLHRSYPTAAWLHQPRVVGR